MQLAGETFRNRSMELPDQMIAETIDTHIHSGPWLKSCPGRLDPFQIAEQARDAGMKALVYYDHTLGVSAGTAWLTARQVPGIEVYGGIILTSNFGGLNPRAVKTALHYGAGAKFVHMGAHCTYHLASREGTMVEGEPVRFADLYPKFAEEELSRAIRIPLEDPIPGELEEILGLVAEHPDVYLNTGHVSGSEAIRLVELAGKFGISKVLIAHPARVQLSVDEQKDLAAKGAFLEGCVSDWFFHRGLPRTNYYVEREYRDEIAGIGNEPKLSGIMPWISEIREVGFEHFILGTDYGIRTAPTPLEGMRLLIASLLDVELTTEEIHLMTRDNPAKLLGIEVSK